MEKLDKEMQIMAVEKVLKEMKEAEEYVSKWKAFWWEQCLDARTKTDMDYIYDVQKKYMDYYILEELARFDESEAIPLRKVILEGIDGEEYQCEFDRILWGMNTNKSRRSFSFKNNGDISFSKSVKGAYPTLNHSKQINYEASYNVLSNDFKIEFIIYECIEGLKRPKVSNMVMSLSGNILTRKYNGSEIILDLNTGVKQVKIDKKYDKTENNASVVFEAKFNADEVMEMGKVDIHTHKGNGKINGTYQLYASLKKGISARFISRKGINVDLNTNPMLTSNANKLLLPVLNSQSNGDLIISEFTNPIQNEIANSLAERIIIFDNSAFNFQAIKNLEKTLTDIIKEIKGELPLPGLVERINNCLDLIAVAHNLQITDNQKVLSLK